MENLSASRLSFKKIFLTNDLIGSFCPLKKPSLDVSSVDKGEKKA